MRLWGLEEWRDLDAALSLAERKGAKDVVIIGSGFGASIVSTFLHESPNVGLVRGVIYDSPVLDLEGVATRWAADHNTPSPIAWLGRKLAAVRFSMDWNMLNQHSRTEQFDVPILLMFGAEDLVTPSEEFVEFADALPDFVEIERFEQGGHTDLWRMLMTGLIATRQDYTRVREGRRTRSRNRGREPRRSWAHGPTMSSSRDQERRPTTSL
jgi:hypothetical protein